MKHTEGKWFIEKGWNKAEMHIVANDKTIEICRTIEANIPIEEGEANAKLISKAPEMYEALKWTYDKLAKVSTSYPSRDTIESQSKMASIRSLLKEIESLSSI